MLFSNGSQWVLIGSLIMNGVKYGQKGSSEVKLGLVESSEVMWRHVGSSWFEWNCVGSCNMLIVGVG